MSHSFPPGRFIWCNDGTDGGPTARPIAKYGGHSCCNSYDYCNYDLRPIIRYYGSILDASSRAGGICITQ